MSQEQNAPCEHHCWTNSFPTRPEWQKGEPRCSGCGLPQSTHKFRLSILRFENRSARFKRLAMLGAPEIIIEHERLLLVKACEETPTTEEIRKTAKELNEQIVKERENGTNPD